MSIVVRPSVLVSPYSREGALDGSTPASAAWPAANRAFYQPIRLPRQATVRKLWWLNGATVGTDNVQMGVYLPDGADGAPGTRVIAGSATLSSGANSLQFDDITDVTLAAGTWWLAMWANGTTTTVFRVGGRSGGGQYLESGLSGGLPATATPAATGTSSTSAFYAVCGLQLRASP